MNANTCEDVNNDLVKTKVTHDPGWNDPPVFSYDAVNATAQSKTPKRGLLLNKRVAFPLSSQPASNMPSTTNTVLPPIPSASMSPAMIPSLPATAGHANTGNNITEENAGQGLKREDSLQRLMEDFEQILKDSANDLQRNGTEIRRRLDIMKRMWEEDKLKPEICIKMTQLATALRNGNGEVADHIHMGLMVDHVSMCSPWMVGVRQLIHHVKSRAVKQDDSSQETLHN